MTNHPCFKNVLASIRSRGLGLIVAFSLLVVLPTALRASDPKIAFDVPAGDAGQTLKRFAQQAGRQMVYRADAVQGVQTNAVKGEYAVMDAIGLMLSGTVLHVVQDEQTGALAVNRVDGPSAMTGSNDPSSPNVDGAAQNSDRPREYGSVTGTLVEGAGHRPVKGATVTVQETGQKTTTDEHGQYQFPQLAVGTYQLVVQGEGFGRLRITDVVIKANGTLTLSDQTLPAKPAGSASQPELVVSARDLEVLQLQGMEVKITVQKRGEESAQDVPISLTSVSSATLNDFQISDLKGIANLTPNLLVSAFSVGNPTIAIRGAVNTFSQIGVSKPVAVVVDDVFMPRNTDNTFDLFDLSSIQVLRGPQGTLFGQNVTGGAVVINTLRPSLSTSDFEAQATYGNYNDFKFETLASTPITNDVAGKFTFSSESHDGYGYDLLSGRQEDNEDSKDLRGQVLVAPSETFDAIISADYSIDSNGGRTLSSEGLGDPGNPRVSDLGYPQQFNRIMEGLSGHLEWDLPVGNITSISAYRHSESGEDLSATGVSYLYLTSGSQSTTQDNDNLSDLTEELRYATPNQSWGNLVAGTYFLYEDGYRNLFDQSFAAKTGVTSAETRNNESVISYSYAGFLDATIHLVPSLDLTVGGRYTEDTKVASLIFSNYITPSKSFSASDLSNTWGDFTPRGVLTWALDKNLNVYGSVTQGYTAGGYNPDAVTLAALTTPFNPETVTNYEFGTKGQWFGGRLQADADVFDEHYKNKQELVNNTVTGILTIQNASQATMKGGEADLTVVPLAGLNITGTYGHLVGRYGSFVVPGVLNDTGNPMGSAPDSNYSIRADDETRLSNYGYFLASISHTWTNSYYTGATESPQLYVPAYSLTNASVGWEAPNRKWRITLWEKNMANTDYLLTPSTQGVLSEYVGPPRTYGVTVWWHF